MHSFPRPFSPVMRVMLGAALLILCSAQEAWAANPTAPKSANALLPVVEKLYNDFEFDAALDTIKKAYAVPGNGPAELTWLGLMEGLIYIELNRNGPAKIAFKRALSLDPTVKLPYEGPPIAGKIFREVQKELKIATEPAAATPGTNPSAEPTPWTPQPLPSPPKPGPSSAVLTVPELPAPLRSDAYTQFAFEAAPAPGAVNLSISAHRVPPRTRWLTWTSLGVGAGCAVAGGAFLASAQATSRALAVADEHIVTRDQLNQTVAWGKTAQSLGWSLMTIGIVGLGTGAVLYTLPNAAAPSVSVGVAPTGQVFVSGRLP